MASKKVKKDSQVTLTGILEQIFTPGAEGPGYHLKDVAVESDIDAVKGATDWVGKRITLTGVFVHEDLLPERGRVQIFKAESGKLVQR